MSVSHQRSLPGINPGSKNYQSFTDTTVNATVNVQIGPLVGAAIVTDQPLTALQHGMLTCTPTASRTWTLPLATTILANLTQYTNIDVGDGFEFIIRNLAAVGSGFDITLDVNTGITADSEANLIITPGQFSKFILRCDDPNPLGTVTSFEIYQVDSGVAATPGPAYLSAEATTIGAATTVATAGTAVAFANLTFTVGAAPVAPAQGITLTGPVSGSTTFTVANAGIYEISASVSGDLTVTNSALIFVNAAVGGVAVAQNMFALGNDTAATDPHGDGAGSIILALADADVISLFVDTDQNGTIITAVQVSIEIHRIG